MAHGLVSIQTQDQVTQQQNAAVPMPTMPAQSLLVGHIMHAWNRNKRAREKIDRRLLACLRARKSVYSDAELADFQRQGCADAIYVPLTATKCRAGAAWIRDILMPDGDRAWGLEPTTLPDLPEEYRKRILTRAAEQMREQMVASGRAMPREEFASAAQELADKAEAKVKRAVKQEAQTRAERMSEKISDLQDEGGYDNAMEEFIEDFVTYPVAILKGPYMRRHKRLQWAAGWQPVVDNSPSLGWKRVSPFDCYPAPHAQTPQQREFIERIRLTESELYDMIGVPGYSEWDIRQVLQGHTSGQLKHWIWTDSERNRLEGDTSYDWLTREDMIDGLHYWGAVQGRMLLEWGYDSDEIEDPDRPYEVDAIMIGNSVIRCVVNDDPLGQRPYHKACYEAVPGGFWGRAVPELNAANQDVCNAAVRALTQNLGIASGPQVYMEVDRMADGEVITQMHPWKIWQFKSDPTAGTRPPIGFFQPGSNATELLSVFDRFERLSDDATGIPRYTYGNERVGGAGNTATGLSMLFNAASKGLRRAIAAVDRGAIAPTIYQTFVYAMLYVEDQSIKGDCIVVPRGAAALLIKEQAQVRRQEALAATANPIDMRIIGMQGRAKLLREYFRGLEVGDVVPSDEELAERQAEEQEAQTPPREMVEAEISREKIQSNEQIEAAKIKKDLVIAGVNAQIRNQPRASDPSLVLQ